MAQMHVNFPMKPATYLAEDKVWTGRWREALHAGAGAGLTGRDGGFPEHEKWMLYHTKKTQ